MNEKWRAAALLLKPAEWRAEWRECVVCGLRFQPTKPWQRYCKPRCGTAMRGRRRNEKIKRAMAALEHQKSR